MLKEGDTLMDKQTIQKYGWTVILTIIFALMLAFTTPLGDYVGDAVVNIAGGYKGTVNNTLNEDNVGELTDDFTNKFDKITGEDSTKPNDTAPCSHTSTKIKNAKTATCKVAGYTGDTVCAGCGVVIQRGQTIPVVKNKVTVVIRFVLFVIKQLLLVM